MVRQRKGHALRSRLMFCCGVVLRSAAAVVYSYDKRRLSIVIFGNGRAELGYTMDTLRYAMDMLRKVRVTAALFEVLQGQGCAKSCYGEVSQSSAKATQGKAKPNYEMEPLCAVSNGLP